MGDFMNLENKLKDFEESCLRLASKETEILKEDIKKEIEEQLKVELNEYAQKKEWNFNKTMEKMEKDYMKDIFLFQTECKKEILRAKQEVELDLKNQVIQLLENYTNTEQYKLFLFNKIENLLKKVKDVSNIKICIVSKDFEKFASELKEKFNSKIEEMDKSCIGGCILKSNEVYIDDTLLNSVLEKFFE